jgi:hypothetical protein
LPSHWDSILFKNDFRERKRETKGCDDDLEVDEDEKKKTTLFNCYSFFEST